MALYSPELLNIQTPLLNQQPYNSKKIQDTLSSPTENNITKRILRSLFLYPQQKNALITSTIGLLLIKIQTLIITQQESNQEPQKLLDVQPLASTYTIHS